MDGTIAPYALFAQVQDILGTVAEGHPIQQVIYTAVIAVVQVIINADQLLGAGGGRGIQKTGLVAPASVFCSWRQMIACTQAFMVQEYSLPHISSTPRAWA